MSRYPKSGQLCVSTRESWMAPSPMVAAADSFPVLSNPSASWHTPVWTSDPRFSHSWKPLLALTCSETTSNPLYSGTAVPAASESQRRSLGIGSSIDHRRKLSSRGELKPNGYGTAILAQATEAT